MRTAVVCESWFGNTRRLAEAIAGELRKDGELERAAVWARSVATSIVSVPA